MSNWKSFNKKNLLVNLYKEGVDAVLAKNFIPKNISLEGENLKISEISYDLGKYRDIYILGSGKASIQMAESLMGIIGSRVKKCVVVSNHMQKVDGVEVVLSSHPLVSQKSITASNRLIHEFSQMHERDLCIYLLSGGTSALIENPIDGVSLEELQQISLLMLESGLDIKSMNTVRKSLSKVKGGGLIGHAKCDGVALVLSDVIGNDLTTIGSAPLYPTENTLSAISLLKEFCIWDRVGSNIKNALSEVQDKVITKKFPHIVLACNLVALDAINRKAKELNIKTKIISSSLEGDVEVVAKSIIKDIGSSNYDLLLFGGESTVKLKGNGKGGRNQELSLWVLKGMSNNNFTFLSAGSDGIDGNSNASGGVIDYQNKNDSIDSYLLNNDSYHYLKKQKSLVQIGDSGTNVMDIMIALMH